MNKLLISILCFTLFAFNISAQSLEDEIDKEFVDSIENDIVDATFKSIMIINSHSIKSPKKSDLYMVISHRFGLITDGFSDFFGMDNANIRLGVEYGLSNKLAIGLGRSSFNKNYDFFAKYKLLQQQIGNKNIPLSVTVLGVTNISSEKWPVSSRDYLFSHRMNYTMQLLIARKFNNAISLQLMPTYIHKNLVANPEFENDILSIGLGGRIKLTQRFAFTYEYHYAITELSSGYYNPLSLGVDIETGGHVFQLFFSNAAATYETGYLTQTTSDWLNSEILFGFNISRTF